MSVNIGTPPSLTGTSEKQLLSLRSYLYQLSGVLNSALNNLTLDNFTLQIATALGNGQNAETAKSASEKYENTKAMIIKNANYVSSEIERIETTLQSNYVAQSEFGAYRESIVSTISAQADALRLDLDYSAEITTLSDDLKTLTTYYNNTSGYIKAGIVEYENSVPILGIAIGQNIAVNENGEIVKQDFFSTYTSRKLSFWQGETEIFYIKDGKIYAGDIEVTGKMVQGSWQTDTNNGWTLRWIGA